MSRTKGDKSRVTFPRRLDMEEDGQPLIHEEELGPINEIEIERESEPEVVQVGKSFRAKSFYDGTVSGWIDKHSTKLWTVVAVLSIFIISILVVVIYQSGDEPIGNSCWPTPCQDAVEEESSWSTYAPLLDDDIDTHNFSNGTWAFRLPSPTNRNLRSVTYFRSELVDGSFAAVGDDSTLLVSRNGSSWSLLPPVSPVSIDLVSIVFSADTFYVEAAQGQRYLSYDLVSWVPSQHSFSSGIATGDSVSIGLEDDTLWIQDLSQSWIRVTMPDADALHDVSYGNNIFVVLGTTHLETQPDAEYACVWTSPNGRQWTMFLINGVILRNRETLQLSMAPTADDASRGVFLVFADELYTSRIGEDWVPVRKSPWVGSAAPTALACALGGYCSALSGSWDSEFSVLSQSFDYGQTWISKIVGSSYSDIADNNRNTFVVVGKHASIVQGVVQDDSFLMEWNQVSPHFGEQVSSLIYANHRFLASSTKFVTYDSVDGIAWTNSESPPLSFIAYGNSVYLGVYNTARDTNVYHYVPSVGWELVHSLDGFYQVTALGFDGEEFYILGRNCDNDNNCDPNITPDDDDDSGDAFLTTSSQGLQWVDQSTIGVDESYFMQFVRHPGDTCYFGVTHDRQLYITSDLENEAWNVSSALKNVDCVSVAVSHETGITMALCRDNSHRIVLASSMDCGVTWSLSTCTCAECGSASLITYINRAFYLGGGQIMRMEELAQDEYHYQVVSIDPVRLDRMDTMYLVDDVFVILSEGAVISNVPAKEDFVDLPSSCFVPNEN